MKFAAVWLAFATVCSLAGAAELSETDVYVSGAGGYHTYRIPSVIQTKKGTLLAFCEGRKKGRSDAGDIDLLLRRSSDGGQTWTAPQVVWDDDRHTCGNPCPVVDQSTGTIWLLLTWNNGDVPEHKINAGYGEDSRRVFVAHSKDDGQTWTKPENLTADVKKENWSWYATGPGCGIQLENGQHAGRLVVPCDHKIPAKAGEALGYSHVVFSDDHGKTWQLGGATPRDKCNECEVVELTDGKLLLNMRSHDKSVRFRQVATSDDAGATWSEPKSDETLIEPICQASIRRYRWPTTGKPGVILFSNPASQKARENLTLRASFDDGRTWPQSKQLHAGGSAYSCLCVLADGTIGVIYERDNYSKIVFARVAPEELFK
jgi:sialidase-1